MIRKATKNDIAALTSLYERAIDYEDSHSKYTSWQKGIYPTEDTARAGIEKDSLFVLEENGDVLASVVLDHRQPPEYRNIPWGISSVYNKILVIHILCVDPEYSGGGLGTTLLNFIKQYAKEIGCEAIRLNTTARNAPARHLYEKNGFSVVAKRKILLNGQIPCDEHLFIEIIL
jgi:ribosomal protein S18 acetylase RimI-like enzyme